MMYSETPVTCGRLVQCRELRTTPKGIRTRRQRRRWRSFGRRSQTNAWNEPMTKAARSGKRTPSSRGRRKAPTGQDSSPPITPVTS